MIWEFEPPESRIHCGVRPVAAAARACAGAAALAIAFICAYAPARTAASQLLGVFRVRKFQAVQVNLDPTRLQAYGIPATRFAEELGHKLVLNMVMVGFLTAVTGLVTPEAARKSVADSVPKGTQPLNTAASKSDTRSPEARSTLEYVGKAVGLPGVLPGTACEPQMTTVLSQCRRSSDRPSRADASQSRHEVRARSATEVPCPATRIPATVWPPACKCCPSSRISCGVAVKPCRSRQPTRPPAKKKGLVSAERFRDASL